MTTPNEELIDRLYDWHNTSAEQNRLDMQKAADLLQSQAERIKVIERESEMRRIALHDVMLESDQLRAQLAVIAATEPEFVWLYCETCEGSGKVYEESQFGIPGSGGNRPCPDCNANGYIESKLFTRPMPAQDVTELVELLEFMWREVSMDEYAFEKLEAALFKYKGAK